MQGNSVNPQSVYRPYSNGRRIFYGCLWSLYTVLPTIATISGLSTSPLVSLICVVLMCLTGYYAYRIWMWRARRLWLLIIF